MISEKEAEEFKRNSFEQMHKLWIEPELARRRASGSLPDDFRVYRFLIKFPQENPVIVEFNDEIGWRAKIKPAPGALLQPGQTVYVHDIQEILTVEPPQVNGQRVAFIYFFWNGHEYNMVFDFTPNWPEDLKKEEEDWQLGKVIAESLQAIITEKSIYIHDDAQTLLRKVGLWAVPALLPFPLSKIAGQLKDGNVEGARNTLLEFCTPEYIEALSSKWWSIPQFDQRRKLIQDAMRAHSEKLFNLSIHALLPQVEGIVTDWVYSRLPEGSIPWRQESKTRKFRDLALNDPPTTFTYRRIVESTIDFIVDGPVLETFKEWVDEINTAFPNRHVVEHGRYDEALFTEENSVKLFLLIDTVYHIISAQLEGGVDYH